MRTLTAIFLLAVGTASADSAELASPEPSRARPASPAVRALPVPDRKAPVLRRLADLGVKSSDNESYGDLLDTEARARQGMRLKELGIQSDWQKQSLAELRDMESRAQASKRINDLGLGISWEPYTYSYLINVEDRLRAARKLNELGVDIRWSEKTYLEMLDMQNRVVQARKLESRGLKVDWTRYSFEELLKMGAGLKGTFSRLARTTEPLRTRN
jgi:hypothetical protein